MKARAVRLFEPCEFKACHYPATHTVELTGIGSLGGRFCEKHAIQREDIVNKMLQKSPPSEEPSR